MSPSDKYALTMSFQGLDVVCVNKMLPEPACPLDCLRSHPDTTEFSYTYCIYLTACSRIDLIDLAECLGNQIRSKPCSKS